MSSLLLDTNIVSYQHNGHSLWVAYEPLLQGHVLCIAAQTLAEMRFGALRMNWGEERKARLERLLASYAIFFPDDAVCTGWARVKAESEAKGRPMQPPDIWIAATALTLDVPLVTHNRRHFEFLDGLEVISESS